MILYRILSGRKILVGSYKLKDPVREAKCVGLLCNSLVLSRIKSIWYGGFMGISHILALVTTLP